MTTLLFRALLAYAIGKGTFLWRRRSPLRDAATGRVVAWAYGDGRRDDTRHIQRGIDRSTILHLPAGEHRVVSTLHLTNNGIAGDPNGVTAIRMDLT